MKHYFKANNNPLPKDVAKAIKASLGKRAVKIRYRGARGLRITTKTRNPADIEKVLAKAIPGRAFTVELNGDQGTITSEDAEWTKKEMAKLKQVLPEWGDPRPKKKKKPK